MLGTLILGTSQLLGPTGFVPYDQPAASLQVQQVVYTEQAAASTELQQSVKTEQAALTAQLQQVVHTEVTGAAVQLTQSVVFSGGITLQLQQSVIGAQATRSLALQQLVLATSGLRAKWTVIATVDGVQMPKIAGAQNIRVYAEDGRPRTAEWTVINDIGPVYLHTWPGKSVTIDYLSDEDSGGNVALHRLFTGTISKAEYSHDLKRTTFTATDRRKERLNAMTTEYLASQIGGHWSKHVFSEDAEPATYAADRLSTIPASLNFDRFGTLRLASYTPAVSADYTLGNGNVFHEDISFRFATREDVTNKRSVELKYRYSILRHRERRYSWAHPYANNSWRYQMTNPIDLTPREIITGAIEGTGWDLANIAFTPLPPAAVYYISGIPYIWSPVKASLVKYVYKRDANGDLVTDANGDYVIAEVQTTGTLDSTALFCIGASWRMATRYAQTVTETYAVTISAPQSAEQYGEVDAGERGYGVESDYDSDTWEDLEGYIAPSATAASAVVSEGGRPPAYYNPALTESANGDYIWITDSNRAEFDEAARTAIAVERVSILDAHRRNYVDCAMVHTPQNPLLPIDLHHTVDLDTDVVDGAGRVYSVEYTFNHLARRASTGLRLAYSQVFSTLSVSDSAVAAPTAVSNADQPFTPGVTTLQTHVGNQRYSPVYDESWTGLMTNYTYRDTSAAVETYPHGFVVDAESAEDRDRDERELEAAQTYTVEIPHDPLTIYKVA